jgi:hypothetical protein
VLHTEAVVSLAAKTKIGHATVLVTPGAQGSVGMAAFGVATPVDPAGPTLPGDRRWYPRHVSTDDGR